MGDMVHVKTYNVILYDTILYDEISSSNCIYIYICSALVTKVSLHQAEVENSRVLPRRDIAELK